MYYKEPSKPQKKLAGHDRCPRKEAHETMIEAEWLEATEAIPGRPTANIPQEKGNRGARQVEQSSVRYRQ